MSTELKTYSELISLPTLIERYEYLKEDPSCIGETKFGYKRILNQDFYNSTEWKSVRRKVILRDDGCDMALKDYPINGRIIVHHMNRITPEMIVHHPEMLLNPDYLVCVSLNTHYAISYGDQSQLPIQIIERVPFDTCPWRK